MSSDPQRPNIVLVMADDVNLPYHGCYGGPTPTPTLNRLAREGALFHRACGVAPLCNPSRYTIFTGQVPGRAPSAHRRCTAAEPYSIQQNAELEPDMPTLARCLKGGGYLTGHVGKWHSSFSRAGTSEWPKNLGPDADPDDPEVDAGLRELQRRHQKVVAECAHFDWVCAVNWGNLGHGKPKQLGYHNPAWKTDAALRFLDEAARHPERPFYLHLANTVPHGPSVNHSLGQDHRYTLGGKLDEPPHSHPDDATVPARLKQAGLNPSGPIGGINTGIVMIDDQLRALMAKLEALGMADNTIVIYTADHGIFGKGTCYLGGFHMPLIMRWPEGIRAGQAIHAPVSLPDLYPTLLEAAGVAFPEAWPLDGVSFLGHIVRGEPAPRAFTYQEMGTSRAILKGKYHYVALRYPQSSIDKMRTGQLEVPPDVSGYGESPFGDLNFRYKPNYFEPDQLYDIEADPLERHNRAADPAYDEVLADLKAELARVVADLPGPYPMEIDPFLLSDEYRALVERRRARLPAIPYHPQGHDAELIYNRNLPDPLTE